MAIVSMAGGWKCEKCGMDGKTPTEAWKACKCADKPENRMDYRLHVGDILPNGARVLSVGRSKCGDLYVVCEWKRGYIDPVEKVPTVQWVTWSVGPLGPESTNRGHYFKRFVDAAEDFEKRVAGL